MYKKLLALVILAILLFISFKYWGTGCDCELSQSVTLGGTELEAYIRDTDEERAKGLSGREGLDEGEGMLFIFDYPAKYGFWMKDMKFAIDIIWISEEKKIVGIERGVQPATYPDIFYPPSEVIYVLEVPSGFSDTANFEVGQSLSLEQ